MSSRPHPRSLVIALVANLLIAGSKYIAAVLTGSAAMLAEAIHSTVDTGNEIFLFIGIRRSRQIPDEEHPFGYGKELYFWSFLVAVLVFTLGCGVSVYQGVTHLLHPQGVPTHFNMSCAVLAIAGMSEGYSFWVAFIEFRSQRRGRSFWLAVRSSKDPTTFTVLFEDGAALIGVLIAFTGLLLGKIWVSPYPDAVASILIGILLAGVALFLGRECKGLLIGEGVSRRTLRRLHELILADDDVQAVHSLLSLYFGPEKVLLALDVQFHNHLSGRDISRSIERLEEKIKATVPVIQRIFIEAKRLRDFTRSPSEIPPELPSATDDSQLRAR